MDNHPLGAVSTIATAPSPATTGTSLVLASGDGTYFPDPATVGAYNAVVCALGSLPNKSQLEVIRITAKSSDTLTITRAQEGSSARTIVVGDLIYVAITPKVFTDIEVVTNLEFAYQNFTSIVTLTSATESSGTLVVTAPSFTVDGSTKVCVEFFCSTVDAISGNSTVLSLFEGSTQITRMAYLSGASGNEIQCVLARYFYTPSNASHTLKITGISGTGSARCVAGSGGTGGFSPGYIRVTRA